MWVIRSARPCWLTAATESPPPTTTVAPRSARSARKRAIAFVPWANDGISKTPSGPFQNTVWTSASASSISVLAGLAEVDDVPRGRDLLGRERLVLRAAGDLLGHDDVDRQDDPDAVASAAAQDPAGVLDAVGLGQALADALPWASRNVLAIPPPMIEQSTLVSRWSMTSILSRDLGAADDRRERPLGVVEELARASRARAPSAARRRPAGAWRCRRSRHGRGGRCRTRR